MVRLEHRELGIVTSGNAFVAEHPANLVHTLHTANDEPLQVQLQRDAQVQLHVERIVMGDERSSVCAASLHVEHRGFHLHVSARAQGLANAGDDGVTHLEGSSGIGVDDEVGIALTESCVHIREAVPLVGHRAERLCQ